MIVDKMKDSIVSKSSKYQIGGLPKHRPQEHIFTAKSIIALSLSQGKCVWMQLYDIQKFFDKENLRDAMNTLHCMEVEPKLYRLWYLKNHSTRIRVKTAVGYSDWAEAGELIGQGTGGGAVVSAGNLDYSVHEIFEGSQDEMVYGLVGLQPTIFQDDICRLVRTLQEAQAGTWI